jgi:hypothetical protein
MLDWLKGDPMDCIVTNFELSTITFAQTVCAARTAGLRILAVLPAGARGGQNWRVSVINGHSQGDALAQALEILTGDACPWNRHRQWRRARGSQ